MDIHNSVIEVRIKTHDRAVIEALIEVAKKLQKSCWKNVHIKEMTLNECQDEFKQNLDDLMARRVGDKLEQSSGGDEERRALLLGWDVKN